MLYCLLSIFLLWTYSVDGDGDSTPGTQLDVSNQDDSGVPDSVELLLTAPTGKAANLLGKRAGHPSFTLHQVIYSFRNLKHGEQSANESISLKLKLNKRLVSWHRSSSIWVTIH